MHQKLCAARRVCWTLLTTTAGAAAAACAHSPTAPAWLTHTMNFEFTGGVQTFVVPAGVDSLRLTAAGAGGGATEIARGFPAASMTDVVLVSPGDTLRLIVGGGGGAGIDSTGFGAGGGGGSLVFGPGGLLIAAGGSGGAGADRLGSPLCAASPLAAGNNPWSNVSTGLGGGGLGGVLYASAVAGGGGGGGTNSAGGDGEPDVVSGLNGLGGQVNTAISGGAGGKPNGGYGGGGGGSPVGSIQSSGGGGGGYTGGAGGVGSCGGGGGSFTANARGKGALLTVVAGATRNTDGLLAFTQGPNGQITISW